jgi:hypothetical protein
LLNSGVIEVYPLDMRMRLDAALELDARTTDARFCQQGNPITFP